MRAFFLAYPTVTVINIAEILTRIETVVDQITVVIRFLAGFSIFAGLTILASSIASINEEARPPAYTRCCRRSRKYASLRQPVSGSRCTASLCACAVAMRF